MDSVVNFVKANAIAFIAAVVAFFVANQWFRSDESVIPFIIAVGVFFAVKFGLAAYKTRRVGF